MLGSTSHAADEALPSVPIAGAYYSRVSTWWLNWYGFLLARDASVGGWFVMYAQDGVRWRLAIPRARRLQLRASLVER